MRIRRFANILREKTNLRKLFLQMQIQNIPINQISNQINQDKSHFPKIPNSWHSVRGGEF